jgi:ATP-binding cassette subfamily C protein CydD
MNLDRRLLGLLSAARGWFAVAVGSGVGAAVCAVVQAWALSRAIGGIFLRHDTLPQVAVWLALFAGAAAVRAALGALTASAGARVAERIKRDRRDRLAQKIFALGPEHAAGGRSGELANTLTRGVEALDAYFAQYLPQLFITALALLVILAAVVPRDWLSGVIMLITAPLIPFFMMLIGSTAKRMTDRQWQSLSRMSAHFLDVLQGLPALKLLGRAREQADGIAKISDDYRRATMRVLRVAFLSALALEMLATISTAIVAVALGLRLLKGGMEFEPALMVLILCPEFYGPLRALGARFHAGMEGVSAAARLYEILVAPESPQRVAAPTSTILHPPSTINHPPLTLSFSNICFSYPGRPSPALDSVSFALRPGEITALVGASGAGKSTAAKLLLRFVAPDAGQIRVNGVDLATIPAEEWRRLVAWLPQRPHLFHGTLAENIRLAKPEATDAEVEAAARAAHVHEFVAKLPQGYDTLIGERGARLSGGQAQRVALARAFLKNAPLLILDEPTSFLDATSEAAITEAMTKLAVGRTTLLIAHRQATIQRAANIIVLDHGRLVEQGSPAQLVARGEDFAALFAADAEVGA